MRRSPTFWNSYTVEVSGSNRPWLKRLHGAGLVYDPTSRTWTRHGLTEEQAKSLVGRMRQAGLKALLRSSRNTERAISDLAGLRPYQPTPYDLERERRVAEQNQADLQRRNQRRARSAKRKTNTSLAGSQKPRPENGGPSL